MDFPEHKYFKSNYDTINEMLLLRIFRKGSVQFKIDILNNKAKEYFNKTSIPEYAPILLQMKKAIHIAWKADPSEPNQELFSSRVDLFKKAYDIESDDLMICASFENLAKAILLSKNYMVHVINKPSELNKKQRKNPISFEDILNDKVKENLYISHNTIGLNTILINNRYLDVIDLDDKIIEAMKICRSVRNAMHFGGHAIYGYSEIMLEGLVEYSKILNKIEITTPEYPAYYGG